MRLNIILGPQFAPVLVRVMFHNMYTFLKFHERRDVYPIERSAFKQDDIVPNIHAASVKQVLDATNSIQENLYSIQEPDRET